MDEKTIKEMNDYYKLKQKYDNQITSMKNTILKNDDLSKKDKRRRFQQLKLRCIQCRNQGGTLFENKKGLLRAVCGNTAAPCNLNIVVKKGQYVNIQELDEEYLRQIEVLKRDIIEIKLKLLFNIIKEEESLEKFEVFRRKLSEVAEKQLHLRKKYNDIFNNKTKENELRRLNIQLLAEIEKIKELSDLYDSEQKEATIKSMVEQYLTLIMPIEENIATLKYIERHVEYDEHDKTYHLIDKLYNIEQLEEKVTNGVKAKATILNPMGPTSPLYRAESPSASYDVNYS